MAFHNMSGEKKKLLIQARIDINFAVSKRRIEQLANFSFNISTFITIRIKFRVKRILIRTKFYFQMRINNCIELSKNILNFN